MTTRAKYLLAVAIALACVAAAPVVTSLRVFNVTQGVYSAACPQATRVSAYVNSKLATCCNSSTTTAYVGGSGLCNSVDAGLPICNGSACNYHDCFECENCSTSALYVRRATRTDAGCKCDGGSEDTKTSCCPPIIMKCVEGR